MTIEERIQRLEDIEAIRYLQAKYQRCLDCRDFDGINECFASDVVSSYGNGEMAYTGAENVIAFLASEEANYISGTVINVDGLVRF
jgi:hypothetical protein